MVLWRYILKRCFDLIFLNWDGWNYVDFKIFLKDFVNNLLNWIYYFKVFINCYG